MQRRDACRHVAVAHLIETGGADHARKTLLIGKAADTLDEILVAVAVVGHSVVWHVDLAAEHALKLRLRLVDVHVVRRRRLQIEVATGEAVATVVVGRRRANHVGRVAWRAAGRDQRHHHAHQRCVGRVLFVVAILIAPHRVGQTDANEAKIERLIALANSRCFLPDTAVIREGTILPRSDRNPCSKRTSL